MRRHRHSRNDGGSVEICVTDRDDGDFHIDSDPATLSANRANVMPGIWAVVRQVHGGRVVAAKAAGAVPRADALITDEAELPIAVQGADCAPIAFVTDSGPIGVAHVGWRGLLAGVIENTAQALRIEGARIDHVLVGPCIGPECYEFGAADLADLVQRFGGSVASTTKSGAPALDLRAGIRFACERAGVDSVVFEGPCTACGGSGFSHRDRGERERHALVARITSNAS